MAFRSSGVTIANLLRIVRFAEAKMSFRSGTSSFYNRNAINRSERFASTKTIKHGRHDVTCFHNQLHKTGVAQFLIGKTDEHRATMVDEMVHTISLVKNVSSNQLCRFAIARRTKNERINSCVSPKRNDIFESKHRKFSNEMTPTARDVFVSTKTIKPERASQSRELNVISM